MDPPPVQYVRTSDGFDIAYCDCGRGVPLVLMPHPFGDIQAHWRERSVLHPWFHGLADRFRLVTYDGRGQGASTRGLPETVTWSDFERDLDAVVERLDLDRFYLMGMTYSGITAIRYAATHPERVIGLVLSPATVRMDAWSPGMYDEFPRQNWEAFLYRSIPPGVPMEEVQRIFPRLQRSITQHDWLARSKAYLESDTSSFLPDLRIPVLVLHPRDPTAITMDDSRKLASMIPGARFVLIEGGAPPGDAVTGLAALDAFVEGLRANTSTPDLLTPRELEVLRLLAAGKSNPEIATSLVISVNTVQRHVSNILQKAELRNRAEAVAYAIRNRLV